MAHTKLTIGLLANQRLPKRSEPQNLSALVRPCRRPRMVSECYPRQREYPHPPPPSKNNTRRIINMVVISHLFSLSVPCRLRTKAECAPYSRWEAVTNAARLDGCSFQSCG